MLFYSNTVSQLLHSRKSTLSAHFQCLRSERQRYHWQEGRWNAGTGFSFSSRCRHRNWLGQGWLFSGCGKVVFQPPGNSIKKTAKRKQSISILQTKNTLYKASYTRSSAKFQLPSIFLQTASTGRPESFRGWLLYVTSAHVFELSLASTCTYGEEADLTPGSSGSSL